MKLTTAEEQIMNYLWKLEKAFMKDLVEQFPEPRPAYTTIATLLSRMINKGFVDYKQYGNVREYFPLIKKPEYFSDKLGGMIKSYFNNSDAQFASFFTGQADMNLTELESLKKMIEDQIKSKKDKNE
ncbi:MAG: BlaI/MecI/CopY family transcriptional regulator [Mariniphaga sp.]|nr:BlaI/MecI/CopY family transcriptional regulator [Mariniphaga sp.]